jgi:hypothetical protein
LRNEDGSWRYEFLAFGESGEHEVNIRPVRNSKQIRFLSPIRVRVWPGAARPVLPKTEARATEVGSPWIGTGQYDLSRWATIHDQGTDYTSPAYSATTAMEICLHQQGKPISLSARYIFEKAKDHDELKDFPGTFLSTIAYTIERFGAPPEADWPDKPTSRFLPPGTTWALMGRTPDWRKGVVLSRLLAEAATEGDEELPVASEVRDTVAGTVTLAIEAF